MEIKSGYAEYADFDVLNFGAGLSRMEGILQKKREIQAWPS